MSRASSVLLFVGPQGGDEALAFIRGRVPSLSAVFDKVPLCDPRVVKDWTFQGNVFGRHVSAFFQLIGGLFSPGGRETGSWPQPLLQELGPPGSVLLMAFDPGDGDLQFLVQVAAEPGNFGVVYEGSDEELERLATDKRGEIITYEVGEGEGKQTQRGLLSTLLFRPSMQASSANIASHDLRVPLVRVYRDLAAAKRIHLFGQPEDGGRFYRKRNLYGVAFLTEEERDRVNAEIENPPTIPVDAKVPDGAQKPAWSGDNFCWVSLSTLSSMEREGAANAYLTNLAGRAVRLQGKPVEPLRFAKIVE